MAAEFIIADQTSTYSIDNGDEIFLIEGVTLTSSNDAFSFVSNAPGDVYGTYELVLGGNIYVFDDVVTQSFTYVDGTETGITQDVEFYATITDTASIVSLGDAFVLAATDVDIGIATATINNAGSVFFGEAFLFANNFDRVEVNNTGSLFQTNNANNQAVFDDVEGEVYIYNSGEIRAATSQLVINTNLGTDQSVTLVNTGVISTDADLAFDLFGTSATFDVFNSSTGTIIGGIETGTLLEFGNDGQFYGDIETTNSGLNNMINNGIVAGDITTFDGADSVSNTNQIIGDIFLSSGTDQVLNDGDIYGEVDTGSGNDFVVNRGHIEFDVLLGDDVDTYIGGGSVGGAIYGGAGDDTIETGDFDDLVFGGAEVDIIRTAGGNDFVEGDEGNDIISTGDGDDEASGGDNADILRGGRGDDNLSGNANADELHGQKDDDILNGGGGGDMLFGGRGDDTLDGSSGADTLSGGHGDDELTGGSGADIFVFKLHAGNDVITDFEDGTDLFDFSAFTFDTQSDLRAAGENTATGWMLDFSLIGGSGTLLIEGVVQNQIGLDDLVV